DPIKTGIQGFTYDIRTALLPFLFLFNTELLLMNVTPLKAVAVFVVAVIAMMLFASATQGFLFTRNRIWETVVLLLVAFTLFRPGFWLDRVSPPFDIIPGAEVERIAAEQAAGADLRVRIAGPDFTHPEEQVGVSLIVPLGDAGAGLARLEQADLLVTVEGGQALLEEPFPGTQFAALGNRFDFYADTPVTIESVSLPRERVAKEVFYLPAAVLLALVLLVQLRRRSALRTADAHT
ncbi:MAG: DUF3394 domain-containing protein, partial [Gammaproteobacteria bacterium]|nr:DUF3394 domain-containing protein [Gammaproteobacteria bacterium]NIT63455.1 DUF3394 domain-containing protein [Gammaproteobacteria bacterium]NIV20387.1 DUF3394 domain-containing protein [Gammaproteobacteria bacterium]NIY32035.1 DUF3394 domain-containing protein [Gammaproteobacteria bacterium]